MLHSANTKVRGRFSEKRLGLSHRCARNASAALENFVRHPQKTFSTVSVKNRSDDSPARLPLCPDQRTACPGVARQHPVRGESFRCPSFRLMRFLPSKNVN